MRADRGPAGPGRPAWPLAAALLVAAPAAAANLPLLGPILLPLDGGPEAVAVGRLFPPPAPDSVAAVSWAGFPGPGNVRVWTWQPQPSLFSVSDLLAGNQPKSVAIGDAAPPAGQAEIVVANATDGTLSLFAANLSPTPSPVFFQVSSPLLLAPGSNPVGVAVAAPATDPFGPAGYRTVAAVRNGDGVLSLVRHDGTGWTVWNLALPVPACPVACAFGLFVTTPGATPTPLVAVADGASRTVLLVGLNESATPSPQVMATICLPTPGAAGTASPVAYSVSFGEIVPGDPPVLAVADPAGHRVLLFGSAAAVPTVIADPPLSSGGKPVFVRFRALPNCTCTPSPFAQPLLVVEESAQSVHALCGPGGGVSAATGILPRAADAGDIFGSGLSAVAVAVRGSDRVAVYFPPGAIPSPMTASPTPSASATASESATATETATATDSPVPPPTVPASWSVSRTATGTPSAPATDTPTTSGTRTASGTSTISRTPSTSRTAFLTTTWTATACASPTPDTPTSTWTETETATATPASWAVSRNFFSPRNYEAVRLTLPDGHGRARAAVYTPSGSLVRDLGETEEGGFDWNGLNDQGDVVGVGIYLVHARTAVGARIFRVAVIH